MTKYIIAFTILIFLISCEKVENDRDSNIRIDKNLIAELYAKSVDTLNLESGSFVLDAYLYRDFMPFGPPDGKPMISINWLRKIDSTEIPKSIDLIKQYVIYNDSIWISEFENKPGINHPAYKIEKISLEGPKWGPKVYVDVISIVHDSIAVEDYYIITKNVYIERTD